MIAPVRAGAHDTEIEAAETAGRSMSRLQYIVLSIFSKRSERGMTDSELDSFYGANWWEQEWPQVRYETPRKRRSDLTRLGLLADSGEKELNDYNSAEVVWEITSAGRDALDVFLAGEGS